MRWSALIFLLVIYLPVDAQEFFFREMPIDYKEDIQKINILFQGKDQMIWLGTDQGLYSYDGRKYRRAARPDGINNAVTTITQNLNGDIWTGYEDGYIHTVTRNGFNAAVATDSIGQFAISKILFHPDGITYVATYGAGLWKLSNSKLSRVRFEALATTQDIYDAMIDRMGRIWLGTDHGIWIYQNKQQQSLRNLGKAEGLPDEIVTKLLLERSGDIWIGFYDQGLGRYLIGRDTIISIVDSEASNGSIVSLVHGFGNDVWYSTEKTIGRYSFNASDNSIKPPIGMRDRIEQLLFDQTGNIWIASGNKLFMANTHFEQYLPGLKSIQTIIPLRDRLWIGCENGLYSLDRENGILAQHLQKLKLNILTLYADPDGLLWIGTFGQGLFIYDTDFSKVKNLTEEDLISNNSILNIDGDGKKVWLATLGGITEITWSSNPFVEKPVVTRFREKFDFPPGFVYDVYVGKDDKVWFGTDGKGLYCLDDNELRQVSGLVQQLGKDSFDLRTIYSIAGDAQNHVWVSGVRGHILRLDHDGKLQEHIASAPGLLNSLVTAGNGEILMIREGTIQIKNPFTGLFDFAASTGLNTFSPNINSSAEDEDGSVWIADTDKILHYSPSTTDSAQFVQMHLVEMAPGILRDDQPIRLKPDSNFLDLHFTGLWYSDPARVQYRYMLKGHDLDWIYTQEGRAVYSKLSPGTYTFMVAGSHNEDFSGSVVLEREVIVMTPFYLTWWFISGMILLIGILAFLYFRARIHRLQRIHMLEKEKTAHQLHAIQAQVNPHFLFNSFNTLSSIIEEDQKSAVDYVDQLSGFFRGVLMHRNTELISIKEEINIMRNYTYILKKRHGDNIIIEEHIHSTEGYIVPLTIQLLVENAGKHNKIMQEKPLIVKIVIDEKYVSVSNPIQPKIQVMAESTGFGLSSLLTRYQYLTTSRIEIINDGNTFTVRIPIVHSNTSL